MSCLSATSNSARSSETLTLCRKDGRGKRSAALRSCLQTLMAMKARGREGVKTERGRRNKAEEGQDTEHVERKGEREGAVGRGERGKGIGHRQRLPLEVSSFIVSMEYQNPSGKNLLWRRGLKRRSKRRGLVRLVDLLRMRQHVDSVPICLLIISVSTIIVRVRACRWLEVRLKRARTGRGRTERLKTVKEPRERKGERRVSPAPTSSPASLEAPVPPP